MANRSASVSQKAAEQKTPVRKPRAKSSAASDLIGSARLAPGSHFLLTDVDWATYSEFLRAFADSPRLTPGFLGPFFGKGA